MRTEFGNNGDGDERILVLSGNPTDEELAALMIVLLNRRQPLMEWENPTSAQPASPRLARDRNHHIPASWRRKC